MMTLDMNRLLPGTRPLPDDGLLLPPEGGGLLLDSLHLPGPRYLSMDLEVREDHSQALELRFFARDEGKPRFTFRFGLLPHLPARVVFDMSWLDGHVLFPGHLPGQLKTVCHGSRIARAAIHRAELRSCPSHHEITVAISRLALLDEWPALLPLPSGTLVDELGQLKDRDWPGKAATPEMMAKGLREEMDAMDAWPAAGWNQYGGLAEDRLAPGSGFFKAIKREGRWLMMDPEGCRFFSLGMDCVNLNPDCRVDGMESLLDWLPDPDLTENGELFARRAHPWGEAPRERPLLFSFHRANLRRVLGPNWHDAWRAMIARQLRRAGINTLGNWSEDELLREGRLPYVTSLKRFPDTREHIFRDFPDVFSPEYEEDAARCAQALEPFRGDRMMIGYFLRNEPAWAFVDGLNIALETLRCEARTHSRAALICWLKERYPDIRDLNAAWGTDFSDYGALEEPLKQADALPEAALTGLRDFSRLMVERYVALPSLACRAVDPDHLNLGMRWAWISSPEVIAGWEHFDVFSINCYAMDPTAMLDQVAALGVDRPMVIGEFHFGALDAGLSATGLKGVTSQEERGKAYLQYAQRAAAHPLGVGCHVFQCYDQFPLGRFDGENYNIGLFDTCFRPHRAYEAGLREAAATIYAVQKGELAPDTSPVEGIPMIAY